MATDPPESMRQRKHCSAAASCAEAASGMGPLLLALARQPIQGCCQSAPSGGCATPLCLPACLQAQRGRTCLRSRLSRLPGPLQGNRPGVIGDHGEARGGRVWRGAQGQVVGLFIAACRAAAAAVAVRWARGARRAGLGGAAGPRCAGHARGGPPPGTVLAHVGNDEGARVAPHHEISPPCGPPCLQVRHAGGGQDPQGLQRDRAGRLPRRDRDPAARAPPQRGAGAHRPGGSRAAAAAGSAHLSVLLVCRAALSARVRGRPGAPAAGLPAGFPRWVAMPGLPGRCWPATRAHTSRVCQQPGAQAAPASLPVGTTPNPNHHTPHTLHTRTRTVHRRSSWGRAPRRSLTSL